MLNLNARRLLIQECVSCMALCDAAAFKLQVCYYTACFVLEIYFDIVSKFVLEFIAQAATREDICCVQPG